MIDAVKKRELMIDDRHELYEPYKSLCPRCKHFDSSRLSCEAFPEGIPERFLSGVAEHRKPVKGQIGDFIFTTES